MIVEDSAVVRTLLTHIINADPRLTMVLAVASAEEALEVLDEVKPDVISMDIRLPGMDGLAATRRIRQIPGLARLPVLALTAGALADERRRADEPFWVAVDSLAR